MAKFKRNAPVPGLSSRFGNTTTFRQMKDGPTTIAGVSDFSSRVFREGMLTHQSRFRQAAAYAHEAAKNQPIYTALSQNTPCRPYNLAFSDWLHAPVIHEVICLAECIRVDATDNVLVTKVIVTISDENEQLLEQGEANLISDAWWEYRTSAPTGGSLIVEAFDLAGNVTKYEA